MTDSLPQDYKCRGMNSDTQWKIQKQDQECSAAKSARAATGADAAEGSWEGQRCCAHTVSAWRLRFQFPASSFRFVWSLPYRFGKSEKGIRCRPKELAPYLEKQAWYPPPKPSSCVALGHLPSTSRFQLPCALKPEPILGCCGT